MPLTDDPAAQGRAAGHLREGELIGTPQNDLGAIGYPALYDG
jgi:hypothetical protein